ncbi:hypothetical protein SNEBB_006253 [Seison nebaliae]|nr:hypothetical protein SNEBB_006253 [Seison nebaliae]
MNHQVVKCLIKTSSNIFQRSLSTTSMKDQKKSTSPSNSPNNSSSRQSAIKTNIHHPNEQRSLATSATQMKEDLSPAQSTQRVVFRGHDQSPMFVLEENEINSNNEINDGEIFGVIKSATICLSDIHTCCGTRIEPTPSVLGHEAVVEVINSKRDGINENQRITFSVSDSCGHCFFCRHDLPQKCEKLFKYGHSKIQNKKTLDGCYSTHIIIKKGTAVAALPNNITNEMGAPINCAFATSVNCCEYSPGFGRRALIQGDGLLGIYICAILNERGYEDVFISGRRPQSRREIIEDFGGKPLFPEDIDDFVKDHKNNIDFVVEACGNVEALNSGMEVIKPGGTYVLAGMVHPRSRLSNITGEQVIRKCLQLQGIHNYAPRHLIEAVHFMSETADKYPYHKVVGECFPLKEIDKAIEIAKSKKYLRVGLLP